MATPPTTRAATRRQIAIDIGLTLFVLWFALTQFGSRGWGEHEGIATEPDALGFGLCLLVAVPLLGRRRFPWPAFALTAAAGIALLALGYAVHVNLGPAVMLYTFAARPQRDRPWLPIAFAAVAYPASTAVGASEIGFSAEDYVLPGVFWAAGWLIGDRRRTNQLRQAEGAQRREREQQLVLAEERTRIARDLHDSAGHAISNILVQAGAARVLLERDPARSREAIAAVEQVARETLVDVERIVGLLREEEHAELAPLPGIDEIGALVETHRGAGLDFRLRLDGEASAAIPPEVDRAGYRIAQEALTNAARHGTGSAELAVRRGPDAVELTVTNPVAPGRASRAAVSGGGRGILGMHERATLLGGTLEAGPQDGRWRLRAVLPYAREPS